MVCRTPIYLEYDIEMCWITMHKSSLWMLDIIQNTAPFLLIEYSLLYNQSNDMCSDPNAKTTFIFFHGAGKRTCGYLLLMDVGWLFVLT